MKLPVDLSRLRLLPKLIVFDLDHTLWPFGVDQFVFKPPYHRRYANLTRPSANSNDHKAAPLFKVFDSEQKEMQPFPGVPETLRLVSEQLRVPMAVASRTEYPVGANSLIDLFGWQTLFRYRQIYPGSKVAHFAQFKAEASVTYDQMLFFDDETRNVDDVSRLGVTCILVDPEVGTDSRCLYDGLVLFEQKQLTNNK